MKNTTKEGRQKKIGWLIVSGSLVAVVGIVFLVRNFKSDSGSSEAGSASGHSTASENGRQISNLPGSPQATIGTGADGISLEEGLAGFVDELRQSEDSADIREQLDSLRNYLLGLRAEEALGIIREYLESGEDWETKLGFALGRDHYLTSAPTMRTFLMDLVAGIDKVTAGQMGRAILEDDQATPDEWALAMRNVAWASRSKTTRDYLVGKGLEMIGNERWYAQPTVGMLQAFDVFVHTEATEVTPQMMELARDLERRDLGQAAFLTMDRLAIRQPAKVLNEILNDPAGYAGREAMVSNIFARSDVQKPEQREVLERYLLDPVRSEAELESFAGVYPSENYIESYNLLTRDVLRTGAEVRQRDLAALQVLEQEWLSDPRFADRKAILQQIRSRLRQFLTGGSAN